MKLSVIVLCIPHAVLGLFLIPALKHLMEKSINYLFNIDKKLEDIHYEIFNALEVKLSMLSKHNHIMKIRSLFQKNMMKNIFYFIPAFLIDTLNDPFNLSLSKITSDPILGCIYSAAKHTIRNYSINISIAIGCIIIYLRLRIGLDHFV